MISHRQILGFERALQAAALAPAGGIGTLAEKSLHAVLKYYVAENETHHEVKLGGFVADALVDGEIVEIQTGSFFYLRKKLEAFLKVCSVTVVYPVAAPKYVMWQDEQTGEVSSPRKSSKSGTPYDLLAEMVHLLPLLKEPSLSFRVLTLQVTDVRLKKKGNRRGERLDRIPQKLLGDVTLRCAHDYLPFLPASLPPRFTSSDLATVAKLSPAKASTCLRVLRELGTVEQVGKQGRAFLYQVNPGL